MSVLLAALRPDVLSPDRIAQVESVVPELSVVVTPEREEIEALLGDVEIAVGQFPHDLLARAPRLSWFHQWGAGADWLLRHPEAATADFVLTSASGVHAVPISEHILAFMLAFARGLPGALRHQGMAHWHRTPAGDLFELAGKTVLLVGVGEIGSRTARAAAALGMNVVGVRRDPTKHVDHVSAMYSAADLPTLLPQADFVVLTVPLTRDTHEMIDEAQLRSMRSSAYLVNVGRGGTVRESSLVRALQEGWIAGAGLDVFEEEPLPAHSPLWGMENVIVTGHYSGATPRYDERAFGIFLDNVRRYASGRPLRNVVDKRRGY